MYIESNASLSHCLLLPSSMLTASINICIGPHNYSPKDIRAIAMTKRTANEAFRKSRRTRSLSPPTKHSRSGQPRTSTSPSRPVQSAPARLEPRGTRLDLGLYLSDDESEVVDEDEDPLLYNILTGLEYTRAQNTHGRPGMQTTRFKLITREHARPDEALSVLRQAGCDGHATRIAVDDGFEVWKIGVPRPDWVAGGAFGGLHGPQWWHGLDATQIKAGPLRTEEDVKTARAALKAAETKRNKRCEKSQREQEIDLKLQEWHRRYKAGETMNDSDGSDTDRSRFASGGSDSNPTDDEDSDDEPITPEYIAKWEAEKESRASVASSTTYSSLRT